MQRLVAVEGPDTHESPPYRYPWGGWMGRFWSITRFFLLQEREITLRNTPSPRRTVGEPPL